MTGQGDIEKRRSMPRHRRAETAPSFGRPCPTVTGDAQRSNAVRIANDAIVSGAVADPVKRSLSKPICGSSEKFIATAACGLTKCSRIKVRSASPITVEDIDVVALGARIMARIQISVLVALDAVIRADVVITLPCPCGPLATTEVTSVTAIELRETDAGRTLRGIGAVAATMFERSSGELASGA